MKPRKKKSPEEHASSGGNPQGTPPEIGKSREKLKEKNKPERLVLVRAKFGEDTTKTNLGTSISGGEFQSTNLAGGRTEYKQTLDPCHAGDYVIEGYFEVDEDAIAPIGRLYHNGLKIHQSAAKKNGENVFSFFKEYTVEDVIVQEIVHDANGDEIAVDKVLGPHDFTVDFVGNVKMLKGSVDIYRIDEYVPPERVIVPTPGIPSDIPMNQGEI